MFRSSRKSVLVLTVVAACILVLASCGGRRAGEPTRAPFGVPGRKAVAIKIPKPFDVGSDSVLGYIMVPSLDATLGHVETMAAAFAPGQTQPGMLKQQLGTMVGDPDMSGLDGSKPILLMILKSENASGPAPVTAFIPVKNAAPYEQALTGLGMQTRLADDILMASRAAGGLAVAQRFVPVYKKIARSELKSDLRISFKLSQLMDVYGDTIRTQVNTMVNMITAVSAAQRPGGQANQQAVAAELSKLLNLELEGILTLFGQVDVVQSDISLDAAAITMNKIAVAKRGSALAKLFGSGPAGENATLALLSRPSAMMMSAQFDPRRLSDFAVEFANQLVKQNATAAEILTPEVIAIYRDMGAYNSGTMAFSVNPVEGSPFAFESVTGVTDEARCLAMIEKSMSVMAPGGTLNRMYGNMGLKFSTTLEKGVREHAGVSIHRLKMTFDVAGVPEAEAAQMKAMMRDAEIAVTKGYYLASQNPAALDGMIDRLAASKPGQPATLKAMEAFGDGWHVYMDLDFIGFMKAMAEMMPETQKNSLQPVLGEVGTTEPMVAAMGWSGGSAQAQLKIPLAPFAAIVKAAQASRPGTGARPVPTPSQGGSKG